MRTGLWDRWGETLQVATKKCKAWSYFYVKSSVFGQNVAFCSGNHRRCVLMCNFKNKNIFPTLIVY